VHEVAGEASLVVEVEVSVLNQQRHLEGRAFGQSELPLALVADDP
jgi:hypothetical protein